MSDTDPNAYRLEADEKRKLAAQLANEANTLEDQARAAEAALGEQVTADAPDVAIIETPASVETSDDTQTKKSRFSK